NGANACFFFWADGVMHGDFPLMEMVFDHRQLALEEQRRRLSHLRWSEASATAVAPSPGEGLPDSVLPADGGRGPQTAGTPPPSRASSGKLRVLGVVLVVAAGTSIGFLFARRTLLQGEGAKAAAA